MKKLAKDLRQAIRVLAGHTGLTATALLTLLLGISANAAVFSLANAVLLKPLPYADVERLVIAVETGMEGEETPISPANYLDWQRESKTLNGLAGFRSVNVSLLEGAEPQIVQAASVSPGLFAVLGARAAYGRTFSTGSPAAEPEVVLLYDFWRRRFGADPGVVGRSLRLDGKSYAVVGITAPGFHFAWNPDLYIQAPLGVPEPPSGVTEDVTTLRGLRYFRAVGRLRPEVSLEEAQAEMDTIASRLQAEYPELNHGRGIRLVPLREWLFGPIQRILLLLFGAVGCVLLIACANVTNLLLAWGTTREREIAIRTAFGAGRRQLAWQLGTETVLLALLGGGLGLLLAIWGVNLLIRLNPGSLPNLEKVSVDARVVGFTMLVSVLSGLFVAILPIARATRLNFYECLKEGGNRGSAGVRKRRLYKSFVVAELAVALILLVGAGLLVRSFRNLLAVDPGFNPENALTLRIALPATKYSDSVRIIGFYDEALMRIRRLPQVVAAAAVADLPTSGTTFSTRFFVEGQPRPMPGEEPLAGVHMVTSGYFQAMEIPLIAGRDFDQRDREGGSQVVIINRVLAERFWPGRDPLGGRIAFGEKEDGSPDWFTVVGVVGDVRYSALDEAPGADAYISFKQFQESAMSLVVRTNEEPMSLSPMVREQILAIDREQPIDEVKTLAGLVSVSTADRRFLSSLAMILAGVGLALALLGIYSMMSYSVGRRTYEMAIRLALGAQRFDVLGVVMREAAVIALLGVVLGSLGALVMTRALSSLLFEISSTDPATFLTIGAMLFAIALLASYMPARRAIGVDPAVAFYGE